MYLASENMVSKVHPLTRDIEVDDPMELVPQHVVGDPEFMLECMIGEFAWMGWDAEQLMRLLRSPEYPVLNQLLEHFGEEIIRQRIDQFLGQTGLLRFQETIDDTPDPDADGHDHEPELLQLSVRRR